MSQVACYIDGFNLYHAIDRLERPELKWLNLRTLATSYLEKKDSLVGVSYFTAISTWDRAKIQRHREYIAALEASGVEVVESRFMKGSRYCKAYDRWCEFNEEKQTDVGFAVRVMRDAYSGTVNRIILITADSDHIPLVSHVRERFPLINVEIAAPPGRMRHARELCATATRFHEVTPGRLRTCLLPRNVTNDEGRIVARCPARYIP